MEKSLALVLPDHPGMLREVMRVLSSNRVSVLRMSYNHVVDAHALFLDVYGTMAALESAEAELSAWRFLPGQREVGELLLLELTIGDDAELIEPVLTLLQQRDLNVVYVDVRLDGTGGDVARVGAYTEAPTCVEDLLSDIERVCPVRLVPKSDQPDTLNNSHFNLSFAHGLTRKLNLSAQDEEELLINSNRIMQNLTSEGSDPFKPFDYISQIGDTITAYRGDAFAKACRITRGQTAGGVAWVCIEPPIGSDTWVFECETCLLAIDAGYHCFAAELESILRELYPDWDAREKRLVLTHADFDHVGLWRAFDTVYASGRVIDNFEFESMGIVGWREQNPLSFPYQRIGGILSGYQTPDFTCMTCLGERSPIGEQDELLRRIDTLEVAPLRFEVWEGKGGHVRGETILIEREHHVCVSGDVYVNVRGQTKPQARFNTLGPYLMTSVDTDANLARQEREALFAQLEGGPWQIMGGHGAVLNWQR